jgi:hypothetical protein
LCVAARRTDGLFARGDHGDLCEVLAAHAVVHGFDCSRTSKAGDTACHACRVVTGA